ncbi:single-stranded DNA-binding protein [Helicobacter aurati]|uniref:Single-stranded DNA-binding protein n=1 Tax=Helicobacter aurati TaxID=137778 RepID=A0A3D8IZY8_9HELI|nr:single-stranded DNA-binding protein [Helicobacter aurati]RDU70837.1 single-stranded DNA-binding protein [Helicobacter aurati]
MFNKVVMIGNLTRDVELRYLNTGTAVATIGLASNRRYKRQDGSFSENTCFIDVTLFGRSAEIANQYLKRGSKILIEGRLHYESWQDQQGNKRSKHTIVAESMQMLDSRQSQGYSMPQGDMQEYTDSNYSNQVQDIYGQNTNQTQVNTSGYHANQGYANTTSNGQTPSSPRHSYNANAQNYQQDIPEINVDSDEEIPF